MACRSTITLPAGSGEFSLIGSANASVSQADVTGTAGVLIASSTTDRSGLVMKNNNTTGILYFAFTLANATTAIGYPLGPGEAMAMDVAAGQAVYAIASSGTIDVRIIQAGS